MLTVGRPAKNNNIPVRHLHDAGKMLSTGISSRLTDAVNTSTALLPASCQHEMVLSQPVLVMLLLPPGGPNLVAVFDAFVSQLLLIARRPAAA